MKQIHELNLALKLEPFLIELHTLQVDVMEVMNLIEFKVFVILKDNKFILTTQIHNLNFTCRCEKPNGHTFPLLCPIDTIEFEKCENGRLMQEIGDFHFSRPEYEYLTRTLRVFYKIG